VVVTTPPRNIFDAPTDLKTKALDDSRIRISWTDNATSEGGYQIQFKSRESKTWEILGTVQPEVKFRIVASLLVPSTEYSFRVRAFKADGSKVTKFSNKASAKTKSLGAPKNLVATPEPEGSFKFKWKDTSGVESGFELQQAVGDGQFFPYANFNGYNIKKTSINVALSNFALAQDMHFRIRTFYISGDKKTYSRFSNVITTRSTTLAMPTTLAVTGRTDTTVSLKWADNSKRETNYQIDFRKAGTTAFTARYSVADVTSYQLTGLDAGTNYEIRVRAILSSFFTAPAFSAFTGTLPALTRQGINGDLNPQLVAGAAFFYQVSLTDLSGLTALTVSGLPAGLNFNQATRTISGNLNQETGFAFVVTATFSDGTTSTRTVNVRNSTTPAKPEGPAVASITDISATLSWTDKSALESGYRVEYRVVGAPDFIPVVRPAGTQFHDLQGLQPGTDYEFQVTATGAAGGGDSPVSTRVPWRTREGIVGNLSPLLSLGVPFSYQIMFSNGVSPDSVVVTGLPAGLTYDGVTRTISGTVLVDGVHAAEIKATYLGASAGVSTRTLNLRTTTPPVIANSFVASSVAGGASTVVSAVGKFSDPDTASAARFTTTKGILDIIFFPVAAPLTVDNFIDYMDAGEYDNMFFHRSPANFVVQGGGYKYSMADGFTEVVKFPAVMNEPGISNKRGTVAMAKLGGNPNSATSEWFVNVVDNSGGGPALDTQNGGFTVFGRVPESGMAVVQSINNLPLATYQFPFSPTAKTLDNVPVDAATAPASLDPTTLVRVTSAGPAPILTYAVTSLNLAVATASITGTDITITGVGSGSTSIQVTATDLDGQSVSQLLPVTVP